MPTNPPAELPFKFRFLKNGQAAGFTAWKGTATAEALTLGDDEIAYSRIVDRAVSDDRLVLGISDAGSLTEGTAKFLLPGGLLPLVVYGPIGPLLEIIDRQSSQAQCEEHRRQLAAAGNESQFHAVDCPQCGATIDLSELPETRYVHCRYCDSIFEEAGELVTSVKDYRLCEGCHMFGRVRGYTEFYFYFLVFVYGYSSSRKHVCDGCAHGLFVKTLLANFLFVLGVPSAVAIKVRSLSGRDPRLKKLSDANQLALAGRFDQSTPLYREMHQAMQGHPGLLYNEAMGYFQSNRTEEGIKMLNGALQTCGNYGPVLRVLAELQQQAEAVEPQPE